MKVATLGLVIVFASTVSVSRVNSRQSQRNQSECREGTGDLGIGLYICNGGDCTVSEHLKDGRVVHRFSVEPRVSEIDSKGPSARNLRENDAIVAVDGSLITSFEGGYKLANARIGVPIKLRVRRNGQEMELQIVPAKGCNLPKLNVIALNLVCFLFVIPPTGPTERGFTILKFEERIFAFAEVLCRRAAHGISPGPSQLTRTALIRWDEKAGLRGMRYAPIDRRARRTKERRPAMM
jgi:hypothetical protein